jgi:hypothetical protein
MYFPASLDRKTNSVAPSQTSPSRKLSTRISKHFRHIMLTKMGLSMAFSMCQTSSRAMNATISPRATFQPTSLDKPIYRPPTSPSWFVLTPNSSCSSSADSEILIGYCALDQRRVHFIIPGSCSFGPMPSSNLLSSGQCHIATSPSQLRSVGSPRCRRMEKLLPVSYLCHSGLIRS